MTTTGLLCEDCIQLLIVIVAYLNWEFLSSGEGKG
jgi:hypothetical protein